MCNTKLGNKRSYIIHLRRHAGMLNFKCKYCTKTFQGRVKLNRHMNTHMRDESNITPPSLTTFNPTSTINPVALSTKIWKTWWCLLFLQFVNTSELVNSTYKTEGQNGNLIGRIDDGLVLGQNQAFQFGPAGTGHCTHAW